MRNLDRLIVEGRVGELVALAERNAGDLMERVDATKALGKVGDDAAIQALIGLLSDEELPVRENADKALRALGSAEVLRHLDSLIETNGSSAEAAKRLRARLIDGSGADARNDSDSAEPGLEAAGERSGKIDNIGFGMGWVSAALPAVGALAGLAYLGRGHWRRAFQAGTSALLMVGWVFSFIQLGSVDTASPFRPLREFAMGATIFGPLVMPFLFTWALRRIPWPKASSIE